MIIALKCNTLDTPGFWFDTFSEKEIAITNLEASGYVIVNSLVDFFGLTSHPQKALLINGRIIEKK